MFGRDKGRHARADSDELPGSLDGGDTAGGERRNGQTRYGAEEGYDMADAADGDDADTGSGPYDISEAPEEDNLARLDLGSVRVPVPENAQLQVEVDEEGAVQAVHVLTEIGRVTVNAFAAPRSGDLWPEVSKEILAGLREQDAQASTQRGEWGTEISAISPQAHMHFIGVDGPRWMLRVLGAYPEQQRENFLPLLREVTRGTIVLRGEDPLPVRTPLPVVLPDELAEQLQAQAEAQAEQAGQGPGQGGGASA